MKKNLFVCIISVVILITIGIIGSVYIYMEINEKKYDELEIKVNIKENMPYKIALPCAMKDGIISELHSNMKIIKGEGALILGNICNNSCLIIESNQSLIIKKHMINTGDFIYDNVSLSIGRNDTQPEYNTYIIYVYSGNSTIDIEIHYRSKGLTTSIKGMVETYGVNYVKGYMVEILA